MPSTVLPLRNGAELRFDLLEPPLPREDAREMAALAVEHLQEDFLEAILLGRASGEASFLAGLGRVGGRLAGTCWSGWGRDIPELAVLAGVVTPQPFRGLGIASNMVGALCRGVDAAGGRLLFLGTSNPVARRIYERLGFRHLVGQIFCRGGGMAELEDGFCAPAGSARAASYCDVASLAPLYLLPHPCVIIDAQLRLPSSRVCGPWRCARLFWETWKSLGAGGRWEVLTTARGWVGASILARPASETSGEMADHFLVELNWHSRYGDVGVAFGESFLRRLQDEGRLPCRMLVCREDTWKELAARRLGFTQPVGREVVMDIQGRPLTFRYLGLERRQQ